MHRGVVGHILVKHVGLLERLVLSLLLGLAHGLHELMGAEWLSLLELFYLWVIFLSVLPVICLIWN